MKRERRLTKPAEYSRVYNQGFSQADNLVAIRAMPNQLSFSRFGISVSKRLGKAVVRNRVKRLLREILRVAPLNPGWDFVVIARTPAAKSDYHQLRKSVLNLLSRAKILAE